MTGAQYSLVGFIDTALTRQKLESECPQGAWHAKPAPDLNVPDGDIVLVLHVSQRGDDRRNVSEYDCFKVCVDALARDSWDEQFADHLSWIRRHRGRISALVLTSGSYVSSHEVVSARRKLEGQGIEVFGWSAKELAGRLKDCSGFLRTSEFLRCLAGDTARESALRLLSALLPFGLLWEAQGDGGRGGLVEAARGLGDDLFNDFERALVVRFRQHLSGQPPPGWEPPGFEHNVARVNEVLSRASASGGLWEQAGCAGAPTELDSAIMVLAESVSLELWNARLTALRESLLETRA